MKPKKKTDCDFVVKAVIIGDSGVGKTNKVEEYKIKLQIWDTAGQEKFKNLSTTFYKGALIIILTYAIDSASSFANV